MEALINDLLTYTRLNVKRVIPEKVNLVQIIDEIKDELKTDLENNHVVVNIGEMCTASIIPSQFHQLMQNLINNSIKFSKKDTAPVIDINAVMEKGISLHRSYLNSDADYCHITFKDNGIGFESEDSEKIFKIFQRLNGRQEYEGTGIGLAIVKKIVDNHKGFITAKGQPNVGAIFDIYFPNNV